MKIFSILFLFILSLDLFAQPLTIGTSIYAPPFEVSANQNSNFFGFDIDIMNAICYHMKRECRYMGYPFDQLFVKVAEGSIDLAISGIAITPLRQQNFLFSIPYMDGKGQFVALSASPINNLEGLPGKRVGVLEGTIYKLLISEKFGNEVKVIEYNTVPKLYQSLYDKSTDAIVDAEPTVKYWIANNGNIFKLVGDSFSIGLGLGIMANKDSVALIEQVNKALLAMRAEGSYMGIYNRYFGF